ncbi:MAG TPA: methionine--tRNA ligase [Candidatus Paceibacterota bacterium]
MSQKPFYITTTLPYVNAEPHVGFAMEIIRADAIARAQKLAGREVFFNTGTDEHGLKIYRKAQELGITAQEYCDQASAKFRDLTKTLGIMPEVNFIRTTDAHHVAAAQEFWRRVDKNGFIYKKNYSVKYCVGCELEKTESELVNGRCPIHPLMEIELIQEENYFFKFSAFQDKLTAYYNANPTFVVPDFRFNEIKAFVSRGLEDFSISRLATKMPWGVAVPGDDKQVMYVWFDALVNYISATGWPDRQADFDKWWAHAGDVVQYCGKDNLRQQSAMWQAMLMAAGLPNSRTIVIDGFITGEGGVKMSKSLGNTIDPLMVVSEYGTEALRYFVCREVHPFEDSPFTMAMFKDAYNAGLANGIGNLTSRIMKMAVDNGVTMSAPGKTDLTIQGYDIKKYCDAIWERVKAIDQRIQSEQPFKLIKTDATAGKKIISELLSELYAIGVLLDPVLPDTSATIQDLVKSNKMPEKPLFMRK